jgi:hypothetical protein
MIEISGSSGCKLRVENNTILKYTECRDYRFRLLKQKDKQDFFNNNFLCKGIVAPKVLASNSYSFRMEYFNYYKNFIDFLSSSSKLDIQNFIINIQNLINIFIEDSKIIQIDYSVLAEKFNLIDKKQYSKRINTFFEKFNKTDFILPIGFCHGDLTFSNMLFYNEKIVVFDFLDSFIETPLQDMVKLRQDTKYFWSLLKYNKIYDKTKIEIILNHIDVQLNTHFLKFDFYKKYYKIFQFINLVRIIPYAKTFKEEQLLISSIESLVNEK